MNGDGLASFMQNKGGAAVEKLFQSSCSDVVVVVVDQVCGVLMTILLVVVLLRQIFFGVTVIALALVFPASTNCRG